MTSRLVICAALAAASCLCAFALPARGQALVVPNEIQQPGTQPAEVSSLESPDKCDNCHGGYNKAVEPAFNWRGSMMANAGRDPIFWATLAIAEQDFKGSGDLCIRCHSTGGWYGGRSTPTDGSGLAAGDADGVDCDTCHKMTNTGNSEWLGVMVSPFVANETRATAVAGRGFHGTGMLSLWGSADKLGPYSDAVARHQFKQSKFHRSNDFCGSCHDVSNPAVGDLAPNQGRQAGIEDCQPPFAGQTAEQEPPVCSGVPGSALTGKAAFNNFPFRYGVVERTWSEFMSGRLGKTLVSQYETLPSDLKAGAVAAAYGSAKGNYADGTPRYFNCQTCHLRAVTGKGAAMNNAPVRADLPLHDMTGGNYWMPAGILDQNAAGTLRLGGGLTSVQIDALNAGRARAEQQLKLAASLSVSGASTPVVRVTNLTGHKLISGYPEGRRMWLNIKWYDAGGTLLREDGKYGDLTVSIDGVSRTVRTILNLADPNTKIYEAHYAMTREWAQDLIALGYSSSMALAYDRGSGAVTRTLGELANGSATYAETFHFVLNNFVANDNRIPTWGMSYDEAKRRNALPVPATQYGSPGAGGSYLHYDDVALTKPDPATSAVVSLMYQPTSWEYVQFLYLANNRSVAFLADEGRNLLDTWVRTGMAEPYVMASTTWGTPPAGGGGTCTAPGAPQTLVATAGKKAITLAWKAASPVPTGGYRLYYDQAGKLQYRAGVGPTTLTYKDTGLTSRQTYTYIATAWADCNGNASFDAGTDLESALSNKATATAQ